MVCTSIDCLRCGSSMCRVPVSYIPKKNRIKIRGCSRDNILAITMQVGKIRILIRE